jgi:hypothetical protein
MSIAEDKVDPFIAKLAISLKDQILRIYREKEGYNVIIFNVFGAAK